MLISARNAYKQVRQAGETHEALTNAWNACKHTKCLKQGRQAGETHGVLTSAQNVCKQGRRG